MRYPAVISKSGGSFLVEFPGLEGCLTEGNTFEDAVTNAEAALNGWLESNYERNLKVNDPERCLKLSKKKARGHKIEMIPVALVLSLAYQMRFSRKEDGNRSLQNLANLMQVSQQMYSKIFENPKANPTLETIEEGFRKLGYFLEINVIPKTREKQKIKIHNFLLNKKQT